MGKPCKPAYFNLKQIYLKSFFEWCVKEGIFSDNPLKGFKKRKADNRIVNISDETLTKLLDLPDTTTFAGVRDIALILFTLDSGARPSEAFSLLPTDINLRSLEVCIRSETAKTRISRTLPICPITAKAIGRLIMVRHSSWNNSVPLFCTCDGNYLNRNSWRDRLNKYSKKLGENIYPYKLRHVFALQFLRNGGNVFALQRTLGHLDLSMTKRYIALTQQDLKTQHSLASPVNKLVTQKSRLRKA